MASRWAISAGGNWSATGTWSATATSRTGGASVPGAADVAIIDGASGNVVVDVNSACYELSMEDRGYGAHAGTLTLTGDLDVGDGGANVSGTVTGAGKLFTAAGLFLLAGSTWQGTGLVTFDSPGAASAWNTGGVSMATAPVTIAVTATTITLAGSTVCGDLTLTSGTLARGAQTLACRDLTLAGATLSGSAALTIGRHCTYSSGTNSDTGTWSLTGSGNVAWNTVGQLIADLRLGWGAGVVSTLIASVFARKVSIGVGSVAQYGSRTPYVYENGNDFWTDGGVVTLAGVTVQFSASRSNGPITMNSPLTLASGATRTLTMTGAMDLGGNALNIAANGGSSVQMNLDLGANRLRCGLVSLGSTSARTGGIAFGSGIKLIGGLVRVSTGTQAVDVGTAIIGNGGTIDGTGISFNGTQGVIHSGIVKNVVMTTGRLLCHGVVLPVNHGNDVNVIPLPRRGRMGYMAMHRIGAA